MGIILAITAGVTIGLFQSINRRAVLGLDVYMATFIQLLVSAAILVLILLVTESLAFLPTVSTTAWVSFALAGLIHFFVGWTFMNASQKRIGAARTTSLVGTLPLFGAIIAAITLSEIPAFLVVMGILLIVGGVYLVNYTRLQAMSGSQPPALSGQGRDSGWHSLLPGLSASICWAFSPIFFRYGLAEGFSPMFGLTFGITLSVVGYGLILGVRGLDTPIRDIPQSFLITKIIAGVLIAISMWAYWSAFSLTSIAIVLALSQISVPIVIFLSPLIMGRDLEQVTNLVWMGAGLIVTGSLVLIFF